MTERGNVKKMNKENNRRRETVQEGNDRNN